VLDVGRYSIALTKHKGKLDDLMSTINKVRGKIVSKKLEMKKLRSEHATLKIEIEKAKEQLKSMTTLIDDFEVHNVLCIYRIIEILIIIFIIAGSGCYRFYKNACGTWKIT